MSAIWSTLYSRSLSNTACARLRTCSLPVFIIWRNSSRSSALSLLTNLVGVFMAQHYTKTFLTAHLNNHGSDGTAHQADQKKYSAGGVTEESDDDNPHYKHESRPTIDRDFVYSDSRMLVHFHASSALFTRLDNSGKTRKAWQIPHP